MKTVIRLFFALALLSLVCSVLNAQYPQGRRANVAESISDPRILTHEPSLHHPSDDRWKDFIGQERPSILSRNARVWVVDTALVYSTTDTTRHRYSFNGRAQMTIDLTEEWQASLWANSDCYTYTYDANGRMLTQLYELWTNNQWVNDWRETYTYDANGNMLTELAEVWTNDQWVNSRRITSTYDAWGRILTRANEYWAINLWLGIKRWTYTYDANGNMLSELQENGTMGINPEWVNYGLTGYAYDANGRLIVVRTYWWGEREGFPTWIPQYLSNYTYDANARLITILTQYFVNGYPPQWLNYKRTTYTYDAHGTLITQLHEVWGNNQWFSFSRYTYTYDANGRIATQLYELCTNNQWVNSDRYTCTYDANGCMATGQFENWQGGIWVPRDSSFSIADSAGNSYSWSGYNVMLRYRQTDIHVVHDVGNVILSVCDNSQLAGWGNLGTSAYWPRVNGQDYLWLGGLWIGSNVNGENRVMNLDYFQTEWIRAMGTPYSIAPSISDQDVNVTYDDRYGYPSPIGFRVHQQSYQWSASSRDDFVIFKYTVRNTGANGNLASVYVSQWLDPDVSIQTNPLDNLPGYDSQRHMMYVYDSLSNPSGYIGLKLLGAGNTPQTVVAYAYPTLDPSSDSARYQRMTSGGVTIPTTTGDHRVLLTSQPFALAIGDSHSVAYGIVLGNGLAELCSNADTMEAIYRGVDNDGLLDLWVATRDGNRAALYRNRGDGTFQADRQADDVGRKLAGIEVAEVQLFDFDNDGWLDLLVVGRPAGATGSGVRLFRNDQGKRFDDFSSILSSAPRAARAAAVADFDQDGDLDVVLMGSDGSPRLLRNDGGNANQYLDVRLVALRQGSGKNNGFGLGASLELRAGDLYQLRRVTDRVTHFGLGGRLKANVLRVWWTNGVSQTVYYPGSEQDVREQPVARAAARVQD